MRKMKTVKLSSLKLRSTHLIHARDPIAYGNTIEVQASAPPPERTFEVACAAHSRCGSRHGGDEPHP